MIRRRLLWLKGILALVVLTGILALPGTGRADVLATYVNTSGPTSDGPTDAQATFSTFTGLTVNGQTYSGIEVVIQNLQTLTGNNGDGQAISGISFNLGPNLQGSSLAFVQDQGPEVTTSSTGHSTPTTVTGNSSNSFLHWGASTGSTAVTLETAGNDAQGGKPNHLIIGALGSGGQYNPSYQNHDPSFLQTATFWIADSAVTSNFDLQTSAITNVQFAFGTTPTFGGTATEVHVTPVPEPASFLMAGTGLVLIGAVAGWRRRPVKLG